jgi:hypothetical protein
MLYRVTLVSTDVSEDFVFLRSLRRLLVTTNFVLSSQILITLIMEALIFSSSVLQQPLGVTL